MAPPPKDVEDFDFGDNVDYATFEQILEMDDPDDDESGHEFSKSIVMGFFEQAETTFSKMDQAMEDKDMHELSSLGHFLKGSSATLGFTRVKDACEKIQNFGNYKDETGTFEVDDREKLLRLIGECLSDAKQAYTVVERLMRSYYDKLGD